MTEFLLGHYFQRKARRAFAGVYAKGLNNIAFPEDGSPVILYANHAGWWDGILPFLITTTHLGLDGYAMMEEAQMQRYSFFRKIGCFSVDRESPRQSMVSLRYGAELLRERRRLLWIFPQGEIVHPEQRPVHLFRGLAWLARDLGNVTLIPVAFRYELGRQERPEAWVSCGTAWRITKDHRVDIEITHYYLGRLLEDLMNQQRCDVMHGMMDDYSVLIQGRLSINDRWDRFRGKN